jgi:hypothetical protein
MSYFTDPLGGQLCKGHGLTQNCERFRMSYFVPMSVLPIKSWPFITIFANLGKSWKADP